MGIKDDYILRSVCQACVQWENKSDAIAIVSRLQHTVLVGVGFEENPQFESKP